ncbi:hypothetical protein [Nautilia lithotrophica]
MFYLPSKDECDEIVANSKQFFCKSFTFKEREIAVYHYKQGNFEEFEKFNAWELRGLTFVKEGSEWNRFPAIHKFFELNQAPGWMEEDLKDKRVIKVSEKIDGTFVHPVIVGGEVYFKSKLRFDSYQALRSQEIYESSENIKKFVKHCFDNGLFPMFEYISEKSQVVMDYNKEALILTQVRDSEGNYLLDFEKMAEKFGVEYAGICENKPLNDYIKNKGVCVSKEGWILVFEDMKFVKVKTDEYLKRHKILGDIKEHNIIQMTLSGEIKDLFEILNPKSEKYEFVKEIHDRFSEKYDNLQKDLIGIIDSFEGTLKEFKEKYQNHPFYAILSEAYKKRKKQPPRETIRQWVENNTKKLKNAKRFLGL